MPPAATGGPNPARARSFAGMGGGDPSFPLALGGPGACDESSERCSGNPLQGPTLLLFPSPTADITLLGSQ